ncbi:hypothetical protein WN51_13632 [Melipona quadrifasciata]|uniref:Uncharacterized protein n=1 Tax=Melipona quadrifasciata TaxID=166423 RepID=A0A0M9A217_9HYME|nr:hypothetical protein WN51_13632 [Melipona quadrifasciata]
MGRNSVEDALARERVSGVDAGMQGFEVGKGDRWEGGTTTGIGSVGSIPLNRIPMVQNWTDELRVIFDLWLDRMLHLCPTCFAGQNSSIDNATHTELTLSKSWDYRPNLDAH